ISGRLIERRRAVREALASLPVRDLAKSAPDVAAVWDREVARLNERPERVASQSETLRREIELLAEADVSPAYRAQHGEQIGIRIRLAAGVDQATKTALLAALKAAAARDEPSE